MAGSETTKERFLRAMLAHVLDHGLTLASLRPLAQAAGTSDRMLIYHFGTKDALVAELLAKLARDLTQKLDSALPLQPMPTQRLLLDQVLALLRSPVFGAYVRLWREVLASAAQGAPAHKAAALAISGAYIDWLEIRMPLSEPAPRQAATAMLALIEGVHVMDAAGRSAEANAAIEVFYPRR